MAEKPDDLEAVRKLVEALSTFEAEDQERIMRWAREKLGLPTQTASRTASERPLAMDVNIGAEGVGAAKDIRTFVTEKNPSSDNQFAATVAHYYRFVAPQANRKDAITAEDLQQACRLTGRNRLSKPGQTLINAHTHGLLDKGANRGEYVISTVGENLVAVSLPGGAIATETRGRAANRKRNSSQTGRKGTRRRSK